VAKVGAGGGVTYSISGRVVDGSGNPIPGVTISDNAGHTTTTGNDGRYTLSGLAAGTYTIIPSKSGYIFSPPSRAVTVPPDATGKDFTGSPTRPGVSYTGPLYLPAEGFMVDEVDGLITVGDHVHLRLPFRNDSNQTITNANVQICGAPRSGNSVGVFVYDGTSWLRCGQPITLTPSTLAPGQTGIADFWIYTTNNDPKDRTSLAGDTWIQLVTISGQWIIRISLSPIAFKISGNDELKEGSCLHHPDNFEIQKYAQYAAGAERHTPPTNSGDPDTPQQAVRNLVKRVNVEFYYKDHEDPRQPDTVLLARRYGEIGVCRDYADLTTGLLRALGLPSRVTDATFVKGVKYFVIEEAVGHAWVEVYLETEGWRQADSTPTWGVAFEENVYEARGYKVKEVWADRHPLSSAAIWSDREYQCIPPCYASPPDCPACFRESSKKRPPWGYDLSCVENVTARYHHTGTQGLGLTGGGELMVRIQAPVLVTRSIPISIEVGIVNSTSSSLSPITATVAISQYVDSRVPLFEVDPPYHIVSSLNPGSEITVTWTITPLLAGNGIPLRVMAESGDYFDMAEWPLVVKEPGAPPPLTLGGLCGPGMVWPGQLISLTAYVLDENLHPLMDALTSVTATVYATPTLGYSTTVSLTPDAEGFFRGTLVLPEDAPDGTYMVDFAATRPGYAQAQASSAFYAAPFLTMTLTVTPQVLGPMDVLTITAHVYERGVMVTDASVWAEVRTPIGEVTVPLVPQGGAYIAAFRPVDLAPNLGGTVRGGEWWITVMTDYQGGNPGAITRVTVLHQLYLPLVLRNYR
jgi:hypothetical protein